MSFSTEDHDRISRAIAEAEIRTSGEIYCVHARRVADHADVVLAWAGGLALLLPLALVPLGFNPAWLPGFSAGWSAGHLAAGEVTVGVTLMAYAAVQALVFAVVCLVGLIPGLRRRMTPRAVRRARCRTAAKAQFLAHGLHLTKGRTGVLVFACHDDHQVEVIADAAIHQRVSPDVWAEAVAALARALKAGRPAEGYEQAITIVGDVLAEHFPPSAHDRNELPDRLVEL